LAKENFAMATQPDFQPDTIEPQSPDEAPAGPDPVETPMQEPPEITPNQPDIDQPGRGPDEIPSVGPDGQPMGNTGRIEG
jgi:hypothetical protein